MEKNQTEEGKVFEGNKLIAEFMGCKFLSEDAYGNGNVEHFALFEPGNNPNYRIKKSGRKFLLTDLIYNESWDWLMPVVEKISKDFTVNIHSYPGTGCDCTIKEGNYRRGYGESTKEPILAVYAAVVQSIQWYNTQTSQTK